VKLVTIGIVGRIKSGKGTARDYLAERVRNFPWYLVGNERFTVGTHSFSDPLTDILEAAGQEKTRSNYQRLVTHLKPLFGEKWLSCAVQQRLGHDTSSVVIVDGVRWESDVPMLRSFNPSCLLCIDSPAEERYKRIKAQNEKRGDLTKTWEKFLEEERALSEMTIEMIGRNADYTITNNRTDETSLQEFMAKLDEFFLDVVKPLLQPQQ